MKIISFIFMILLLTLIVAFTSYAGIVEGRWDGTDKALHVGASMAIGAIIAQDDYTDGKTAFALAMVPGIVKEFGIDKRPSYLDLLADAIGAGLGVSIVKGFKFVNTNGSTLVLWITQF